MRARILEDLSAKIKHERFVDGVDLAILNAKEDVRHVESSLIW